MAKRYINYAARRRARVNQHAGQRAAAERAEAALREKLNPTESKREETDDQA